jgi:hypothetical protein
MTSGMIFCGTAKLNARRPAIILNLTKTLSREPIRLGKRSAKNGTRRALKIRKSYRTSRLARFSYVN